MEQKKTNLIEAAVEFLSRGTSTSPLNEKADSGDVESSAYMPRKNHRNEPVTTTLYSNYYKDRAKIHQKEIKSRATSAEDKKVDQGHIERANAAHEAHTHAISVHHSPTSSSNEKRDAAKKAVHASLKYWKHNPLSIHDQRSDRSQSDYHTNHSVELSHPDMKNVK